MLILDKLCFGEVGPGERRYRPNKEYSMHFQKMEKCERFLEQELSDAEKLVFQEYVTENAALATKENCDSFIAGFRTAVLMMLDVFCPTEKGREFEL